MALDSCPAIAVPLGSEDHWFVELVPGAPFVVLVGSEVEAGKRARTASTIVGMSSLVKGSWTRLFFEGVVVVEAPWTLLSPERVCLLLCWFLAGPPVRLFFLRGGIIDTKKFLTEWQLTPLYTTHSDFFAPSTHVFNAQIFSLMPVSGHVILYIVKLWI